MYCFKQITEKTFFVGGNDRRLDKFENVFPIPEGVSYNSYLILDKKTALLDTVDKAVADVFFENIEHLLDGRQLDYVVVHHMEPDHSATLAELLLRHPETKVVCNALTYAMMKQFFDVDFAERIVEVKENDVLDLGERKLTFVFAPMVHWPEVMVSYESNDKILYSADAFGTFGALNGNVFCDKLDQILLERARRYYTNIVGKYGVMVQSLLKKLAGAEVKYICPLHGLVWHNPQDIIAKYQTWSSYAPEDKDAVMIAYSSVYGHTQNVAEILAGLLYEVGAKDVVLYDVSVTDSSYLVAEAFRCGKIVFASTTYNGGVFINMKNFVDDLIEHGLKGRRVAIIENGTWAPQADNKLRAMIAQMKEMDLLEQKFTVKSSIKTEQLPQLQSVAEAIVKA